MRASSAAFFVGLALASTRSASAKRLRWANSSCSRRVASLARHASISALIRRSSSVCGSAKACSIAFGIFTFAAGSCARCQNVR
jgi:hypothetical protein